MKRDDQNWWRGGVIYQIYPRSYLDTSGDGIGDLRGVTEKLDYIASLGVDAIWLSPFFRSPMKDFGYDVSDYRDVDPMFGSLEDFDALVIKAHALGLKVMIDQVLSHTSDQHLWFIESRESRDNARADWYVWADPQPDGSPPNNWLSIFGGSAWEWDTRRRQYYLHNFLTSQPDLNFHNPDVQDAVLADVQFWLDRGVDGFRLDTVNFYFHDQQLRSNPPARDPYAATTAPPDNPYIFQDHVYDKTRPENIDFLKRFRALLDRYTDRASVGELGVDNALEAMAEYTAGRNRLHMAYSFELLTPRTGAAYIRKTIEDLEESIGEGWVCWSIGNHDVMRVVTRWGGDEASAEMSKAYLALLLSLRGSVCIYQGEELGLDEADIPYERLQDPYGIKFWPRYKGRDGCRTPMPWHRGEPHGGFTRGEPWLPVPAEHKALAVDVQDTQEDSVLNAYRRLLKWRRDHPALRDGDIRFLDAPEDVLLFIRDCDEERLLVAINLAGEARQFPLPGGLLAESLGGHGFSGSESGGEVMLPPWGVWFGDLPILEE